VIPREEWTQQVAAARAEGFTFFDMLTAVDDGDGFTVVCCLCRGGEQRLLTTSVPRDDPWLDSVTPLYAGADWHERETAEMYGIAFPGHPNPGPLLLPDPPPVPTPLRKDASR